MQRAKKLKFVLEELDQSLPDYERQKARLADVCLIWFQKSDYELDHSWHFDEWLGR